MAGGCAALAGAVLWILGTIAPLVSFQRCVSPDPRLAWIGVHLTVLRPDPGCNSGQLALNAGPGHTVGLVVMVAVPVLVANLLTALGAIGFWVAARRLVARVADAVRRVWPRLPEAARAIALGVQRLSTPQGRRSIRRWQLDRSPVLRRGPPALCVR